MRKMQKSQLGFSLLELMIVVAIVGILSAIAIPSYTDYVTRANRTDAMETISEIMNQQQRFVLRNRRYATDLTQIGYGSSVVATVEDFYDITASLCDAGTTPIQRCVLLTAAPKGRQAGDGDITLTSRGERAWNGNAGWYHRDQ